MSDVKLLNSGATDAKAATKMVAVLRQQLEDAERRLATQRLQSYEAYVGLFEAATTLRKALREAETIFGQHFKI